MFRHYISQYKQLDDIEIAEKSIDNIVDTYARPIDANHIYTKYPFPNFTNWDNIYKHNNGLFGIENLVTTLNVSISKRIKNATQDSIFT